MNVKQSDIVLKTSNDANKLDKEWLCLMLIAKQQGYSLEEIRTFIEKSESKV